jgi:hypothetical protein
MTEQSQKTYPTILRNHRRAEIVIFDNQLCLCTLMPGDERTIKAVEPFSTYARYESVTWNKDGSVDLVGRDDFREPARGKYILRCLNVHGKDHEAIVVGGLPYNLPRGIPVLAAVELTDPMVVYQSLELKYIENWVPDPAWQGYLMPVGALEAVKTERPAEELAEINQELEELAKKESQAPADTTKEI